MTTPDSVRFIDILTSSLERSGLNADQIVEGEPTTAAAAFASIGTTEVGVWEHTAGASTDVEADEVFVVVAGLGSVTFATGETVDLIPGRLVRLHAGEPTTWSVRETLRKVYVTAQ